MHYYSAYQLNIQSEILLPEFLAGDPLAPADVTIRVGSVPDRLDNPSGKGIIYQATHNQFLLNMDEIARYLVQNGNEIIVEPAPTSLESDLRVFLLGSGMGALLHQRGVLVIHAAALYTPQGGVLLAGHSGIGKSTLLGEMMRRGHKMMVDDVCGLVLNENQRPWVLPGYPRTRLWLDAAHKLGQDPNTMERTRPTLEKYERQTPAQFWDQSAPLRRIYLLGTINKDEFHLKPVPGIHAFQIVLRNTYRQQFLDGLEMRGTHFSLATAVAKFCPVTRLLRPSSHFQLKELADLLEKDLADA